MTTILFFSSYASLTRGGQRSLWYILRDLDKRLYRPVLICQEEGELTRRASAELGVPFELLSVPLLRLSSVPAVLAFARRLWAIARKYGARAVHSEELKVALFLSPLRLAGFKVIWHVRVLWDMPVQKAIGVLVSNKVVCVSRAVAASFPAGFRKSLVVIRNGVDASEFSPLTGPPSIKKKGERLVGYFGGLLPHKGVEVLLRAFALVPKKISGAGLLLAGGGDPEYIRKLRGLAVQLEISGAVRFCGEVSDVRPLMGEADIVAAPSLSGEGLSRSILESMAMGKPIVASSLPQNAELIKDGETGLLSAIGDHEELAAKILALLENGDLSGRLGRGARAYVEANHSLPSVISSVHELYAELFGRGGRE
ncbi:MAG: hypothetical protein A2049_03290 [Elusimicrobia bacterium GWA2_62_23]|nr:MAG: hypothetical protein A2049_03290 [Elusimicrobia bacterium GWA2_62_23]HBB65905.1 hypothetical protein [Elusimicrobiota bacterium]